MPFTNIFFYFNYKKKVVVRESVTKRPNISSNPQFYLEPKILDDTDESVIFADNNTGLSSSAKIKGKISGDGDDDSYEEADEEGDEGGKSVNLNGGSKINRQFIYIQVKLVLRFTQKINFTI